MRSDTFDHLLELKSRDWRRASLQLGAVLALVLLSAWYVGLFDLPRLLEGVPSIFSLLKEMSPPNFRDAPKWVKPLVYLSVPFAFSIAEGIVAGVLSFVVLHLLAGQVKEVKPTMWVLAVLFAARFIWLG